MAGGEATITVTKQPSLRVQQRVVMAVVVLQCSALQCRVSLYIGLYSAALKGYYNAYSLQRERGGGHRRRLPFYDTQLDKNLCALPFARRITASWSRAHTHAGRRGHVAVYKNTERCIKGLRHDRG